MQDVMGKVNREVEDWKNMSSMSKTERRLILRYTSRISANQEIEIPMKRQVKDMNRHHRKLKT